jgi:hypothetical protein
LNLGVRYDIEFPPQFASPDPLALTAYNALGLQKGIQTDTMAWDPKGNGKSLLHASFGMFYDYPLLGLYFLGDASDGSKSGQLLFAGGSPCGTNAATVSPLNLNATNIFQGIQTVPTCIPAPFTINLGYLPNQQQFQALNFPQSIFINQNYLKPASPFPLAFQPFDYPIGKGFVYAYSEIITGDNTNFQFAPTAARPNEVTGAAAGNGCGPLVPSTYWPTGLFQDACFTPTSDTTLLSLDGDPCPNAGVQPWTLFNDFRVARRVYFNERISLDLITDMFNLVNKFNVASVNQLWTNAGSRRRLII